MEDNLIANIKTSRRFNYDIDVQVKRILGESYKRVKRMLKKRKSALNNIAK